MKRINELPLVSVIIPTYKRPGMLGRAIDSVLNQTYSNIEIIVVDDNNEADEFRKETEAFIENRYKNEPKITYLKHEKNKGGSGARNTGIAIAKGEFIAFLDDDDEYYPSKIQKQLDIFINDTSNNIGVVFCGFNYFNDLGVLINKKTNYIEGCENVLKRHLVDSITGTPGLMIEKCILDQFGIFKDLICGQEFELILRLLSNKVYFSFVPEELVKVNLFEIDRITTGEKIIAGINNLLDIKKPYLYLLEIKDKRKVYYFHSQAIYMVYIRLGIKRKALTYLKDMMKYGYLEPRLLPDAMYLLTGYKLGESLKLLGVKLFKK